MHTDYTKICRVCMSDGSRDIFHKAMTEGQSSPLERLLEKLRYVTMMKIEENDDLPRLLCDLCIVQLNVAYNFKRQAVENDTKLRQYFIENGINSNQQFIINNSSILRNSFTQLNASPVPRSFPIVPFIVKTEPQQDIDTFSDITTETNAEIRNNDNLRTLMTNNTSTPNSGATNETIYVNDSVTPSMVYLNGNHDFNSVTPSSDVEFVQNYQTPTSTASTTIVSTPSTASKISNGKKKSAPSNATTRAHKKCPREILNLDIDMKREQILSKTSSRTRRVLPIQLSKSPNEVNMKKENRKIIASVECLINKRTASTEALNEMKKNTNNKKIFLNPFNATKHKIDDNKHNNGMKKMKNDLRFKKKKNLNKLLRPTIEPPHKKN